MDNSTESTEKRALAQLAFAAICGATPPAEVIALATRFTRRMFDSPWQSLADAGTRSYGQRFFSQLADLGHATDIESRWSDSFDDNYAPHSTAQAHAFISDFMRELAHFPRNYHDFICQRLQVDQQSVMDFPITHPIAVEFWAVYVCVEGAATVSIGTQIKTLQRGSVAIVPPGGNCIIGRASNAQHWTYHLLSFRSRIEWLELLNWATELTNPSFIHIRDTPQLNGLLYQTEQLERTSYQPNSLSERLCSNMIENFLIRLRLAAEADGRAGARVDPRIQSAVTYILNHYQQDISVQNLAATAHLSPSRLSALFRQHYGISLIRWRDHIRMQKAKELIRLTGLPLAQIAASVGYADSLYFSRRFKEHTGVAPSQYR